MVLGVIAACYAPPPELVEAGATPEVPIVPKPFEPCRGDDEAFVACIVDGDTFDLGACGDELGERVRMLGIDAPETAKSDAPAECLADEATAFLADAIAFEEVVLTFDRDCEGVFERTLAYVWLVDNAFDQFVGRGDVDSYVTEYGPDEVPALLLNEVMLGEGWAEQFPEEFAGTLLHQDRFDRATAKARSDRRGVWGACGER